MKVNDLIFYYTTGLPASGKSTWALQMVLENPGKFKRVNKDDFRAMFDASVFSKGNENFVLSIRDHAIKEALSSGYNVICDDTNFGNKHVNTFQKIVDDFNASQIAEAKEKNKKSYFQVKLVHKDFTDVPLKTCIERDSKRDGIKCVGEKVIRRMYNQFLRYEKEAINYIPYDSNKPNCIIVDIDGTFSEVGDRSPYDAAKALETDSVNTSVLFLLKAMYEKEVDIIFVTGRNIKYSEVTSQLIERDWKYSYQLYMRPSDDMPDTDVKRDIFNNSIKDVYNVLFVLEDRSRVVEMYRDLGVRCFQVAPGDY
jgi:predicted kinase